ncbi:MAG: hypothetical protein ACXWT0_14905 [Methylobacter sp.]
MIKYYITRGWRFPKEVLQRIDLISKMPQLSRHTGRDCRYPGHREVNQPAIYGI